MAVKIQSFCETKQYLPSEIILLNLADLEQNRMHNQCNVVRVKAVVWIYDLLLPVTFKAKIILLNCSSTGRRKDQNTGRCLAAAFCIIFSGQIGFKSYCNRAGQRRQRNVSVSNVIHLNYLHRALARTDVTAIHVG